MHRWLFKVLIFFLIIGGLVIAFFMIRKEANTPRTVIAEDFMVEKISSMGKLELVKYAMRDVLEKKELRLLLPDKRVLFVASGEATACIDLTKVLKEDVVEHGPDSITVYLPQPEICYVKLDHNKSKVYDVTGSFFPSDTKDLIEGIYKLAEQRLLENARQLDIIGKARQNAFLIFKPMLENFSGKKVDLQFKLNVATPKQ